MNRLRTHVLILLLVLHVSSLVATPNYQWQLLPALPQAISGQFVGVHNAALIVAGGSCFPVSLFAGGQKKWLAEIYIFESESNDWVTDSPLEHPLAYGVTVSTPNGMLCIGGSDGARHYRDVFYLKWERNQIQRSSLPELPVALAFMGGAVLGDKVYVVAGQSAPDATVAMNKCFLLDLSLPKPVWDEFEPLPGPARILPVVAAQDGAIYVMSGCELVPDESGKATRTYLTDAYRYQPGKGWARIAEVPHPVVAAPSVPSGPSHILVFGGDDGENVQRIWELKDAHPGFRREVLAYHTITDTWAVVDTIPQALVTTTAVRFNESIVIPGGEDRPGHRSARVYQAQAIQSHSHFSALDYIALALYFAALVVMGIYFSRREKGTDDFFLAGRRIPWWAAGLSIFGTQLSAITFMAIPAKCYATDWTYILGNFSITLVAPFVVFYYLPFYRRLQITSIYEYLEKRFNLLVRFFGSIAFILFQVGRMAIVIFLPALALSAVTGFNIALCILIMGVLSTLYTVLGGIEAVIWSDVLQVIVLLGGAILSLAIIIASVAGGFTGFISMAYDQGKFHAFNWTWDATVTAVWVVLFGNLLGNFIPYTTDQTVVQRYLTTKDEKQAARSIWTNAFLSIPATILFFTLGTALFVFYKSRPEALSTTLQTDAIFPWFIVQQLPAGISGLVSAGLFAAAMSSLDSSLNSVATVLVTDYYRRFRRFASDKACLRLGRWLTALLGLFATGTALLMATIEIKSVWDLFTKILGLFGGSLAGIFMLGIFTRRAHGVGVFIGAVTSAVVLFIVQRYTPLHFFLYAGVGIVTCVSVGYLMSVLLPGEKKSLRGLTIRTISDAEV
ncbi:sodium/solute symporter [candidate division KSB1 bacterium]|nr:sodium/solute symporter [candidate division KSB1 bacterium]